MVPTPPASRVRWLILSLIFLATTINYVDRIMFGVLMPKIRESMTIDAETYGKLRDDGDPAGSFILRLARALSGDTWLRS